MYKHIVPVIVAIIGIFFLSTYTGSGEYIEIKEHTAKKLLLVPLDGRPPCKDFLITMSKMGDIETVAPPGKAQDYYTEPGDVALMEEWLFDTMPKVNYAIISIDQLMHGGLLASRERAETEAEMDEFIEKLKILHEKNPRIPIYAFYILPRIAPQASVEDHNERQAIMELSRLIGKQAAGLPVNEHRIENLYNEISEENLDNYMNKIDSSTLFAMKLALLAKEGVIQRLILGQDDGEPYSIPNIEKENIRNFLAENEIPESQVFITHGADEIAMTLLAEIKAREAGIFPKIYVAYNDDAAKDRVMPFMAITLSECAEEKIRMLYGSEVSSPEEADFTLYISANSGDTMNTRERSVEDIVKLTKNSEVALVDLSKHYRFIEILLPLLIKKNFPTHKLLAYAGWNTASNSIGTALATGVVFTSAKKMAKNEESFLRSYFYRLTFLDNRILEDAYYLKDVIDLVNISLIKEGYRNTGDLDLSKNAKYAGETLEAAMQKRIEYYKNTVSFKTPIAIKFKDKTESIRVKNLNAEVYFPWPRTFEIRLDTYLELEKMGSD